MAYTRYLIASRADWGWEVFQRLNAMKIGLFEYVQTPLVLKHTVKDIPPRYVFFPHWSWLVPEEIVNTTECVNFHCTPLPYGRGGHPIENMILRGHRSTVVTAHRMVKELDAGPVYGQSVPVSLDGSKDEILERFIEPVTLLVQLIVLAEVEPKPQSGEVVPFQRLTDEDYRRFWEARR